VIGLLEVLGEEHFHVTRLHCYHNQHAREEFCHDILMMQHVELIVS
jgi:hypothetical protein